MDNLFEILGPLVIFTIYGIGALLQKIAKGKEEPRTRERNVTERREQEQQQQQQQQQQQRQYKAAPKDQQEDLMRQLQEALGGSAQEKPRPNRPRPEPTRPHSPQPAHRQTTPTPRSEPHREPAPPPLPVSRPEPVRKEQNQWSAPVREHRSSEYHTQKQPKPMKVGKIDKKMQMPIKPIKQRIGKGASIAQESYGHLAVIQSPGDLQRAILAHEILGPCRAKQRWQRR
ncbi:MAG: hypothetical protein ACOC29_02055 [Candidatus Sumerlaeota bacterium]